MTRKILLQNRQEITYIESAIAGLVAGVTAGILTNPIDVIKTNMMT